MNNIESQRSLGSLHNDPSSVCINRSSSKARFTFSKDVRFKSPRSPTRMVAYDHETQSDFYMK